MWRDDVVIVVLVVVVVVEAKELVNDLKTLIGKGNSMVC